MPVRSVNVTSIEARRFTGQKEASPNQVRIDHNSTVTLVQQISDEQAEVDFRYTASYGGLGIIKLEGKAHIQGDLAGLQAQWQSSNQMPEEVASEVHTAVMRTCVPEAVFLARDLNLPPPIPLPQIKFNQQSGGSQAEGHGGPEVH